MAETLKDKIKELKAQNKINDFEEFQLLQMERLIQAVRSLR